MTRCGSVLQYSLHTVIAVSFIYVYMDSASKSDCYKHMDTLNLATHAIEMSCYWKISGLSKDKPSKMFDDTFSSFYN